MARSQGAGGWLELFAPANSAAAPQSKDAARSLSE